ncbi:myoD family inhibitor domain-containing protein 2 [Esox lucius]|nr:myoD family inhibitor domain-containing protein 2 [Esox lucius]
MMIPEKSVPNERSHVLTVSTAMDKKTEEENRTDEEKGKKIESKGDKKLSLVRDAGVLSEPPVSVRKLSVIPEYEPGPGNADTSQSSHDPQQPTEKASSSNPLFTTNKCTRNSSVSLSSSSSSSHQTDTADCAGIILYCLFCRFYDLFHMLPDTCDEATYRCCPSYRQFSSSVEAIPSNDCNCNCNFDCGLFDSCQETGEFLELAMEISEICYH